MPVNVPPNYERVAATCGNCASYCTTHPSADRRKTLKAPWCRRFDFFVRPCGICDAWVGTDGSTLELPTTAGKDRP